MHSTYRSGFKAPDQVQEQGKSRSKRHTMLEVDEQWGCRRQVLDPVQNKSEASPTDGVWQPSGLNRWFRATSKLIVLLVSLFVLLMSFGTGWTDQVPERPGNHVVDLAGIIGPHSKIEINRFLRELEQKTTVQMAILTIKSLEGQPIEELALSVAHDRWQLGQKGKDNGVLLIAALKERKYRIEVGYGLEGVLPDGLVGGIGRSILVPYFKKRQYSEGILAATVTIANEIAREAGVTITGLPEQKTVVGKSRSSGILGKLFSLGFFLILLFVFIRRPRSFLSLFLLSSMGGRRGPWGGSSGGFGGGGFGGFSGGGGGFGGGGASGGW